MASGVIRQPRSLTTSLDEEVLHYRANSFAALTSKTYSTQGSAFQKFCTEMGIRPVPLSQGDLGCCVAQDVLGKIGFDSSKYSGHSLCRSGASFALQCGLPVDLIKILGDGHSNAVERYLEPAFEMRQQVAQQMGASVGTLSSS